MNDSFTEAAVGIFASISAVAALVYLLTLVVGLETYNGYTVFADFVSVKGVKVDDPVRIAGVSVGRVESIRLYGANARLTLEIKKGVELHTDAAASVANQSIFTGTKFIDIEPGGAQTLLRANQHIANTRPALDTTDLIVGLVTSGLDLNL